VGEGEPEFKVPLSRERDLGFDVSAQPNGEGGSGGYKTGMHSVPIVPFSLSGDYRRKRDDNLRV